MSDLIGQAQPEPGSETGNLLIAVLESQEKLNDGVVRALESMALQSDKYDDRIAWLTGTLNDVQHAILELRADVASLERKARNDGLRRRGN